MTIDTAKELQMNIAKEGLALLVLHPTADVQLHRECISHIGTAWDIPFGDTQEVISLLDRELDAIHAAEKNGTVTHVLPEEELPMNASGLETLDNIWDLFETSLRVDSPYGRISESSFALTIIRHRRSEYRCRSKRSSRLCATWLSGKRSGSRK